MAVLSSARPSVRPFARSVWLGWLVDLWMLDVVVAWLHSTTRLTVQLANADAWSVCDDASDNGDEWCASRSMATLQESMRVGMHERRHA